MVIVDFKNSGIPVKMFNVTLTHWPANMK